MSEESNVLTIQGDLDNEPAGEAFVQAFDSLMAKGNSKIILDLSKVQVINSYGIGKILMCHKKFQAQGGEINVKPLTGFVKETFELLMLDTLFPVWNGSGGNKQATGDGA